MAIKLSRRTMLKLVASMPAISGIGTALASVDIKPGKSVGYYKVTARRPVPYITVEGRLNNAGIAYVVDGRRVVRLEGNPDHIDTQGSLSAPETAAYLSLSDPDRVIQPLKRAGRRGEGKWKRVGWKEALSDIASRIQALLEEDKPEAVCLHMGKDHSGGAWKRFMHSLGSPSIYQSDGLGDLSKRLGMESLWGAEIEVPDFAHAKHILVFGANPYETFHSFNRPIIQGRVGNGAKLTVFDVQTSFSSGLADEWVPVFPGTDGMVALAMAHVIMAEGLADADFVQQWTDVSLEELAGHLKPYTPEVAEAASGVPAEAIRRIAVEFASVKPGAVFSYRGISAHAGGTDAVRACMFLAVLTGNIEVKGGSCLPREMKWQDVEPIPPSPSASIAAGTMSRHLLPFLIKEGKQPCGVLFNVMANPAYSNPAAVAVREVLSDESLVPLLVDFNTHASETSMLADYILPEAHYLERMELASSPSLFPWIGLRQPAVPAAGQAVDARVVMKELADLVDPDGKRGIVKYWQHLNLEHWVRIQADSVPELRHAGGLDALKEKGFWPDYGVLDLERGVFVDANDQPVQAAYGLHQKTGFPTRSGKIELKGNGTSLPSWNSNPRHQQLKKDEFVLVAYKAHAQVNSLTANNKYLQEINHSNPVLINRETATGLGINDGDLVRVQSEAGRLVTRARVTQGIHPKAAAISSSMGHRAFGRVAKASPHADGIGQDRDADVEHNLWWRKHGVSPNDIIPVILDGSSGGQAWNDVVVSITPARPEDKYGDVTADSKKHFDIAREELDKLERWKGQG